MQSLNEDSLLAPDRITNHKSSKKGSKCRSITKTTESQAIVEQTAEPLPETISMNGVDLEDDEDHSELESFNITDNDNDNDDEEDEDDDEEEDEDDEGGYGDVDDEEIDESDDDKSFNGSAEQDEEEIDDVEDVLDPVIRFTEYLLGGDDDEGAVGRRDFLQHVDPVTKAKLEALFETAGMGKNSDGAKQLADPEVLKRLTSSVSCALDEAAAALTRMRTTEPPSDGRSLIEACHEGDLAKVRQLLDDGRVSVHDTTEDGESLLSLACSAGYFELAQVLLAMRANVEDRGVKNECTPLMEAAGAGHADIVKLLIGYCADINAHSTCGNTPLMYACAGGHEEVVEILLAAGSQVEDHNENGHTPLMEAASSGHVGVAKILLKYGAGINTHSSEFKESALTLACYKGHLEMVRFLLACGADQEHKTDEMHTALMEASMDGHVEVARLLLDSGAQVNMPADSFESPLTLAACGGHVELAMLLLERGANIEEVNDEGYTPLMEAAREGHEEMVALLLSQGADINAQTDETQETALTLACCGGFIEVADFLIKAGADLEIGASTPLMEAAQEGHYELVRFLLDAGSDVKAQTSTGDTALSYACENGHTSVAELLMEHHADLEHESEGGRTPLMKAARAGHLSTVQFLIGNGVDINKSTANKDHTALSLACAGGHLNVVELLLQFGADPYQKLKDNSTMLIEAAKGGHTSVVGVLLDYPRSIPIPPELVKSKKTLPPRQKIVPQAKDQQGTKQTIPKPGVRKSQRPNPVSAKQPPPEVVDASTSPPPQLTLGSIAQPLIESGGFDFIEGSGFVIEGLEDKGLDAKSYIASVLKKTQKSTREEQIIQKEQILAELQRVERELQEKAHAQAQMSNTTTTITTAASNTNPAKRHQQDHHNHQQHTEANDKSVQQPPPPSLPGSQQGPFESFSFKKALIKEAPPVPPVTVTVAVPVLPTPTSTTTTSSGGSQCMSTPSVTNCPTNASSSIASRTANLANLPPSERPKAKPSRKICVDSNKALAAVGANQAQVTASKKSQLQAALQQHNQQLLQLQQLQQLNQQLQQQVLQQRQLKQQNQATLTALQQNAISNQKQLATLQYNVAQLQALEQHILSQMPGGASGSTLTLQQNAQLQQRIQQILHQKQQLQQQIRTFQQQVEEQLAYTQHITAPCGTASPTPPPGSPIDGGTVADSGGTHPKTSRNKRSKDEYLCEAVPASHPFQTLQFDASVDQMPVLVDTSQLAAAVQSCPLALDANVQTVVNGQLLSQTIQVGRDLYMEPTTAIGIQNALRFGPYSFNSGGQIQYQGVSPTNQGGIPLIHECSQGTPQQIYGHPPIQQHAVYSFAQAPSDAVASVSFLPCDAAIPGTLVPIGNDQYAFQQQAQIETVVSVIDQPLPVAQMPVESAVVPSPIQPISTNTTCANVPSNNNLCAKQTAKKSKSVTFKKKEAEIIVDPNDKAAFATPVPHACSASQSANPNVMTATTTLGNPPPEQVPSTPPVDLDSATESNHDTALTLACAGGHEELVKLLLGRGADIEHRDKKGFTPLILAATAGHEKVVSILLDNHAEIEAQSERTKDTPLSLACSGGRFEVVDILLKRNANKEHRNVSDYTPLSLAASGGYVNIIKLLLNHGAEINSRTGSKLGISPLMLAAMNGHTTAVKLLLDSGSDINAQIETNRNTALTLACFQGRHEVVSLLLDRKANVEHRAKTGLTPLMEAASGGYVDVGRVLLDKGADVNAPPVPSSRDTALTIAADKGHYRFVELLLSRGAQVDVRNKKGNSSLWLAANGGHLEVVQLLYSAGADIDSQDNRKVSCLMAAFRKGNSKVVKWMVKHVTQFPSDQETARYIQTLTGSAENKDILKRCQQCMEVIRVAKDRQAAEAAKNASSLLEELDREKNLEESKKAAAARKREKKKRKKLERQMKCGSVTKDEIEKADQQDEDEDFEKENRLEEPDEDEEEIVNNHDSGIDANSQGSSEHPEKISLPSAPSSSGSGNTPSSSNTSKKNKKNRNKKNLIESSVLSSGVTKPENDEDTMSETAKTHSEKSVSPTPTTSSSSPPRSKRVFQPLGKNKSPSENKANDTKDVKLEIFEKVVHSPKKVAPAPVILASRLGSGNTLPPPKSSTPLTPGNVEFGWKEVVRKSKKVSVPSHAISRVIGRGGCNINAIRELSGAHIEVEKQAQKPGAGQVERSISIKGSAEATRQAHTWIQAIISNPDKDVVDIIGKQNIKSLQQNHSGQSYLQQQQTLIINNSGLKAGGKTSAKSSATQPKAGTIQVTNSKKSPTSSASQAVAKSTPGVPNASPFPAPKLSSFAAVASGSTLGTGSEHFQTLFQGPPKNLLKSVDILKDPSGNLMSSQSLIGKNSNQQQDQKMEFSQFTTQPSPVPGMGSETSNGGKMASEFSPFKTFKMSWVPELKEEPENKNFARVAATGLPQSTISLPPNSTQEVTGRSPSPHITDMSKAPGYRAGRIGSPHGSTWSNALEPLFPERCNSAPGTPLSPVVSIGPPSNTQSSASIIGKPHLSPGSDSDHFRHGADPDSDCFRSGYASSGLVRSITPDANGDPKDMFRRNPGGGKPGKSSVATPGVTSALEPTLIAEDVIKAAAVQLAATAGFSDFSPTGARGDYQFEDYTQNNRFAAPIAPSPVLLSPSGTINHGSIPPMSKPPPIAATAPGLKLNPNARDFMRSQTSGSDFLRAPQRAAMAATQAKPFSAFAPSRFSHPSLSHMNLMGTSSATTFNILSNQSINALLSQQQPHQQQFDIASFDSDLCGRTLSDLFPDEAVEKANFVSPPKSGFGPQRKASFSQPQSSGFVLPQTSNFSQQQPSSTFQTSQTPNFSAATFGPPPSMSIMGGSFLNSGLDPVKFSSSRPIGSERQTSRPPPTLPATASKNPWEHREQVLYEPYSSELNATPFGFHGALAPGFEQFGKPSLNGGSAEFVPGVTPTKADFSPNFGAGSGGKKSNNPGFLELPVNQRPDTTLVRRNMNNLWGKSWGADDM